MKSDDLHIGAVFQTPWDSRPIRVIAFDEETVMYVCWRPHTSSWGIGSLKRSVLYYRLPASKLLIDGTYLRTDKYTDAELRVHRPDLPFAFARYESLDWPAIPPATPEEFPKAALGCSSEKSKTHILDATRIHLRPFGPKGGLKPGAVIDALNGTDFTEVELLWHAARLQSPHLREEKLIHGTGIYRSGIERGLPSYYILGSKNLLGN